ncbi:hypothetical protein J437_LFUL019627 [Ladona fulva]|uniref:Uncharacterized protein n=1 Tax=Ladona fulva TaxID=123851 RepID=A0A8K0KUP9_LADFU|nr:hypothetical protein J437_LFUL019627 [Ladona fulva]
MPLLKAISRRSAGGWARQVYLASDVKLQISELLAEASWPFLGGIRFYYCRNSKGLEVDLSSLTQNRFYSTFLGSELVVAGKIKNYDEELILDSVSDIDADYDNCPNNNKMINGIITAASTRGRIRFPSR